MKNNFFYFVLYLLLLLGVGSCKTKAHVDAYNARTMIAWQGVYTGLIPSAGKNGINVQLTLNSDETFLLQYHYIGFDDADLYEEGKFTWNETGDTIILGTKGFPNYYRVREGNLLQLDTEGNEITGVNADYYVLKKE